MGRIENKVCIVTGSARGLGLSIAEEFFKEGALIALMDLNGKAVEEAAKKLDPGGGRVIGIPVDVTDPGQVKQGIDRTVGHFGSLDILVNCAGILKHLPIEEMELADFESVIKVNLTGTFLVCKAVVPYMKRQGRGKIVNIASLGGRTGRPGVGVNYAASKAGVIGLTQTLAREVGPWNIYANAIAPGPILTELTKQASPEVFAKWNAGRAVTKDGLPRDIALAALFLASEESDWVTGVTLDVNGGIYIK